MNLDQINQQAVNSLHQYFNDDHSGNIVKSSKKQLSQDEITNLVKQQVQKRQSKIATLQVLRKNINIEAKNSWRNLDKEILAPSNSQKTLSFNQYKEMLQTEKQHQINFVNQLKAAKLSQ
ncbi:MAG: hypothetical protein ACLRT4_01785 [Thomasclavelia sp.]